MADLRLTVSCGDYDRTRFLIDGTVKVPGLELTTIPLVSAERHARFTQNLEFDVCELQMGVYLGWKSRGIPVTAIPAFPHMKFFHGSVLVNPRSRINGPEDLRGKRVGIQAHFNPVALWMRGVLQHEHGVAPEEILWVTNSAEQVAPWEVPPGLRIERAPTGRRITRMLEDGEIDAVMLPSVAPTFWSGKTSARRLWPNYREIEADYYRRTGIFPIRHTVVIKDEILKNHPWVAASVLQAFEQAKTLGLEHMSDQRRSFLAWYGAEMEEEQAFFGADFWSYSLKKNRATLETMLVYAEEQAITTRKLEVDELFAASTLDS